MTEAAQVAPPSSTETEIDELRSRAEELERQLSKLQQEAEVRLIMSELKAEAIRAGIVDLDGLRLVDTSSIKISRDGEVSGAATLITELRRRKPWLFSSASSSSAAGVPAAQPPRQKTALEMSEEEYRSARAALLKRHG